MYISLQNQLVFCHLGGQWSGTTIRTTVNNTNSVNLISTDEFVEVTLGSVSNFDQYRLLATSGHYEPVWSLTINGAELTKKLYKNFRV